MSTNFSPEEGALYARCSTCGKGLADETAVRAHVEETMTPTGETDVIARSHTVRYLHPDREDPVRSHVRSAVDDAITDACDELSNLLGTDGLTYDEVAKALQGYPDFAEAWEEYR